MGISKVKKNKWAELSPYEKERIVRMAWEDRSAFDDIKAQFHLSPNEVVHFMRTQLDRKSYNRWRRRATTQGHLKHRQTRSESVDRFKCSRQRFDGSTKGWK